MEIPKSSRRCTCPPRCWGHRAPPPLPGSHSARFPQPRLIVSVRSSGCRGITRNSQRSVIEAIRGLLRSEFMQEPIDLSPGDVLFQLSEFLSGYIHLHCVDLRTNRLASSILPEIRQLAEKLVIIINAVNRSSSKKTIQRKTFFGKTDVQGAAEMKKKLL